MTGHLERVIKVGDTDLPLPWPEASKTGAEQETVSAALDPSTRWLSEQARTRIRALRADNPAHTLFLQAPLSSPSPPPQKS